jgi:hypothetical protein
MKTVNFGSRMAYIDSLFPDSDEKRLSAVLYGASVESVDDYGTTIKLNLEDEEIKKLCDECEFDVNEGNIVFTCDEIDSDIWEDNDSLIYIVSRPNGVWFFTVDFNSDTVVEVTGVSATDFNLIMMWEVVRCINIDWDGVLHIIM